MKTKIVVACMLIFFLVCAVLWLADYVQRIYPETLIVKQVEEVEDGWKVTFESVTGNRFEYITDDGDIYENEVYSAIMDSRHSKNVQDDTIVTIKYVK